MNVVKMRVTERTLLGCIRKAAASSSNVVFVPGLNTNSMGGMMTYQQAMACLREGTIVGKPSRNAHGDWELQMQRFAANHTFSLFVIAQCDGTEVRQIIVPIKVESI